MRYNNIRKLPKLINPNSALYSNLAQIMPAACCEKFGQLWVGIKTVSCSNIAILKFYVYHFARQIVSPLPLVKGCSSSVGPPNKFPHKPRYIVYLLLVDGKLPRQRGRHCLSECPLSEPFLGRTLELVEASES